MTSVKNFHVPLYASKGELPLASLAGYMEGTSSTLSSISNSYGLILLGDTSRVLAEDGNGNMTSYYKENFYSVSGLIWKKQFL